VPDDTREREVAFELIVVTDAQATNVDAVRTAVTRSDLDARVLAASRRGASAARNVGWRAARAPLVLFIGDDTLPERRLLAEHMAWHDTHPEENVAVLGRVRWADEIRVTPFMRWLDRGIHFDYDRMKGTDVGWGRFYTANSSIKRSLLERAGGFDEERLPFLYEDLDLAYRLRPHGFRLLYNRAASVEHVHPVTVEEWRARAAAVAVAEKEFVRLHPDVPPYFYNLFSEAARMPRARGRAARLARWVPERTPFVGPRVWRVADIAWRQALGDTFLAAWEDGAPCASSR
jgi:glycosyltransferase involved in cell wall biosynthesis